MLRHLILAGLTCTPAARPSAYASTEDATQKLAKIDPPVAVPLTDPDWILTIDDTSTGRRQNITGFGASWTDATVAVFDELPKAQQDELLEDLFGASGIALGLMRHTIGQSDLTPKWIGRWSYDENGGQPDPNVPNFDLTDVGRNMTRWLARMFEIKPDVTLFGSPWSPPAWMKQDNTIQWKYVDDWVRYMVRYLNAFKAQGVNVHAMTMQNEPLHSADSAWTTKIDQSYSAILANKLGPAISAAGLQTEIWAYDHNTDKPEYPDYVLKNAPQIDTVAWHCYGGGWSPLTDFYYAHPGVKQYMTECWTHLNTGENFFDLPGFVTGPLQNFASGALAWTLGGSTAYDVSYPTGCKQCSGVIQVDRHARTYHKTQDYYTLGQFSKFVKKGAAYLSGTGNSNGNAVQATSFLNPNGERVVVIVNKQSSLHLQVHFNSGDTWNGLVPGRSVTTWVIDAQGPPSPSPPSSLCGNYCASTGCSWTKQYSCPWSPAAGSKGRAGNDGSTGYKCCCQVRSHESQPCGGGAHSLPTPSPPAPPSLRGECRDYCASTGCGWTKEWSCLWSRARGSKGWTGNDNSTGYRCCCEARSSESQPCGGPAAISLVTKGRPGLVI